MGRNNLVDGLPQGESLLEDGEYEVSCGVVGYHAGNLKVEAGTYNLSVFYAKDYGVLDDLEEIDEEDFEGIRKALKIPKRFSIITGRNDSEEEGYIIAVDYSRLVDVGAVEIVDSEDVGYWLVFGLDAFPDISLVPDYAGASEKAKESLFAWRMPSVDQ